MKNTQISLAAKVILLAIFSFALTACGGNFVKGGMAPLKGNERVGVLIARQDVIKNTFVADEMLGEDVKQAAAAKVAENLKDQLAHQGFVPVPIPAEKAADLLKAYSAVPRSSRLKMTSPEEVSLGNLGGLFKEFGLDYLLVYEGEAIVRHSALGSLVGTVTTTAVAVATSSMIGPNARPLMFTYSSVVDPDGKISYYSREQFTKNRDIASYRDRYGMAESIVGGWVKARK